jgi:hypothetical protein
MVTRPLTLGSSPVSGENGAEATAVAAAGRGGHRIEASQESVNIICKYQ